jgi:REP element-mobilizing transposase RayT
MPRKKSFTENIFPYHVTARSLNREWFDLPLIDIWDLFSIQIYFLTMTFGVRVHSFVLMSNHFHMLLSAPQGNLQEALDFLLVEVTNGIQKETGKEQPVFDGAFRSTAIRNRLYYEYAYKYVYRNPVEARMCSRVENYPYSSIRGLLGWDRLPFPAFDNLNLIANPSQKLSWLNAPYPTDAFLDEIREAMKEPEFELFSEKEKEARPQSFLGELSR